MAINTLLRPKTLDAIDRRVDRILSDLGNPEPPLDLRDVYELLKLDRQYYTADDPSLADKVASRIRVGALQVLKRPTLLVDIIKSFDLRGFYLPDQRRILIDSSQPILKHRWLEAHEIGHSLLPWHDDTMFGDSVHTLLQSCHDVIEAEANYAAGGLLFLNTRFKIQAADYKPSIESVKKLKEYFGNSYTTTFWRCIDVWGKDWPVAGLISVHPYHAQVANETNINDVCRHFVRSASFAERYSRITPIELFKHVQDYCSSKRGGPLGEEEIKLVNDNGESKTFYFETFSFHHDTLTLLFEKIPS